MKGVCVSFEGVTRMIIRRSLSYADLSLELVLP